MTGPATPVTAFADRLVHLLGAAAPEPAGGRRPTMADVERALSAVVNTDDPGTARRIAVVWLGAVVRGDSVPLLEHDRPALQAVADLFRIPINYFLDAGVAEEIDERMAVAAAAAERGVTVIGPCRGRVRDQDVFRIYSDAIESLSAYAAEPS